MMEIKQKTVSDPTIQTLKNYIMHDWPGIIKYCKTDAQLCFNYRTDLMLFHDIILKGERIVIQVKLPTYIFEKIHACHQGKEKCKS